MLWNLREVTELFHVNFINVLEKIYIGYFYEGFCERERDKITYISAGAGGHGTESCGNGTEKSIPSSSLGQT